MKKWKSVAAVLVALMMMVMSTGCLALVGSNKNNKSKKTSKTKTDKETSEKADKDDGKSGEDTRIETDFGSYTLDKYWVEAKGQSIPPDVFVYCFQGNENSETPPNNIVVRHDTNDYTKDQHEDFCTAILVQVKNQAAAFGGDAHLEAFGEINGCMCYEFVMDCTPYTVQWYFCGEKEFVMVGVSIYDEQAHNQDRAFDVAQALVNSFEWKK